MRELKFRAWNPEIQEMHFSSNETLFDKREFYPWGFEIGNSGYPESGWVFMQYTGVKDKNGNEIYEGDIINGNDAYGVYKGSITWWNDRWCMTYQGPKDGMPQFQSLMTVNGTREVIGNIHQNPELI